MSTYHDILWPRPPDELETKLYEMLSNMGYGAPAYARVYSQWKDIKTERVANCTLLAHEFIAQFSKETFDQVYADGHCKHVLPKRHK